MSALKCPYCGAELKQIENAKYKCPTHKLTYDFEKCEVYEEDRTPQFIKDSLRLLREIIEGKVWLSYGPFDIFDENFKYKDVVRHQQNTNLKGLRNPKTGDVFISYTKMISHVLKKDLMFLIKTPSMSQSNQPFTPSISTVGEVPMNDLLNAPGELTRSESKALTALIADTAMAMAAVLMNETSLMFEDMSNSQVLMTMIYGNKLNVVTKYTPEAILEEIYNAIIEQAKLCSEDNLKKMRSKVVFNNYVSHLSIPQRQGLYNSIFSPERLLIPGNDWVFWHGDVIHSCSNLIKFCDSYQMLVKIADTGTLLSEAYKVWGIPYKIGDSVFNRAIMYVKDDPTLLYMTCWNIVSDRLEKEGIK